LFGLVRLLVLFVDMKLGHQITAYITYKEEEEKKTIDIHITNIQKWMVPGGNSQCSAVHHQRKEKNRYESRRKNSM